MRERIWTRSSSRVCQPLRDPGLRGVEIGERGLVCRAQPTEARLQEPHPGQILVEI